MAKVEKKFVITHHAGTFKTREYTSRPLTLAEAIEYYSYNLEVGASWSHERGNKKINKSPKTINSLITNLTNAGNNAARNGYGGYYSYEVASV